jgi:hypothetical protein
MKNYLFLVAFSLSACTSTQQITWKTGITKASVKLPENAKIITLLDRVQIQYPYSNTSSTVLNPNVDDIHYGALNGFRSSIRRQAYLSLLTSSKKYTHRANGTFPQALTMSELSQVTEGSDVLVALEMLDQKITDTYSLEIRRESLGNNIFREVDYYVGKRTVALKLGWRLYNSATGEVIDQWTQEEDYYYEGESRERIRATSILEANYRIELSNLGSRHGARYAARISPTAQIVARNIYTSGNEYLIKGATSARAENWEDAEDVWLRGIKKETKRKKLAMLYHNLAINEDRKGDNTQAREFAKLAANQHPLGVKTQSVVGY